MGQAAPQQVARDCHVARSHRGNRPQPWCRTPGWWVLSYRAKAFLAPTPPQVGGQGGGVTTRSPSTLLPTGRELQGLALTL